ncbi:MAG: chemotaxis protein CheW [Burkholderiales bacterium]|jgi:twitching motility protein PilI
MSLSQSTQPKDFQSRLNERLREAGPAPDLAARLGLMIGGQRWLVDLSEAGEIVPVPDTIAPVPLTRDWLVGLVNLRGALYTVIDLQRYAQLGRTEVSKESRLLALAARLEFNAAILVTRMLGLRNVASMRIDEDDAQRAPADGGFGPAGRPDWVGRTLVDADGHRWHELDLARLAAGSAFLLAGR